MHLRATVVTALAVACLSGCAAGFDPQTTPSLRPPAGNNFPVIGDTSPLAIRNAFVLGPPPAQPYATGGNAAVYLTIVNQTGQVDRLVSASSDAAQQVTISGTSGGGQAIEVPPTDVTVRGAGPVDVGPPPYAANSITLVGLTRDLPVTEVVPLTLRFQRAGTIHLDAPVVPREGALATLPSAPTALPSPSVPTAAPLGSESPTPTP